MAEAWAPDWAVTEAVMSRRLPMSQLCEEDRCYAVAELTHRRYSVKEIAAWLQCSPRQVKRLRARLSTRVMITYLVERDRADGIEHYRANDHYHTR